MNKYWNKSISHCGLY